MRSRLLKITIAAVLALGSSAAVSAGTPEQSCEGKKSDTAGRYFACVTKAERALVTGGDTARYDLAVAKCAVKFTDRWADLEAEALGAGSMCPSEGDSSSIQDFLDYCEQSVAQAVGGGTLPSNCATCDGDLTTCEATLGTTEGDLANCVSGLGTCNTSLSSALANLTTCNGNLGACTSELVTSDGNLATCNRNLGTCTGSLAACNSDLSATNADLTSCTGNLGTCNGDLSTTNADLTTCSGNLAVANAGTAAVGDVFAGKTFTSTAGLGATGAMSNNGAVTLTPSTSDQAIAVGYHDGSGKCAGDADLVAGNIKNGVNLFGVTGTVSAGGLQKSGQTLCYNTAGTVIACAGTGQDGELQKGVANSFTDNGDGTVTDNLTGLMWEKLSDDGTIHDKDNTYTWANAFAGKVATLNSTAFAGYSDWRVPNIKELYTLANIGSVNPATFSEFNNSCTGGCTVTTCSCTQSWYYWSSSTYQTKPAFARAVAFYDDNFNDFTDGDTIANSKGDPFYVRGVRAGS